MKFVIRIDDVSTYMDHQKFDKLVDLLEGLNMKAFLGFIPDNRDAKLIKYGYDINLVTKAKTLSRLGWIVAMHGLYHLYQRPGGGQMVSSKSEFVGLSLNLQREMIKDGIDYLRILGFDRPKYFFAPSHGYDKVTLKALVENKIEFLLDGYYPFPVKKHGLKKVSCILDRLPFYFRWPNTVHILCLHSNTMSDQGFVKLENYLKRNRKFYLDPSDIESRDYKNSLGSEFWRVLIWSLKYCLKILKK